MAANKSVIALDIGGSSVKSGVVDLVSLVVTGFDIMPIDSHGSADEIIGTLSRIIEKHYTDEIDFVGVGVGMPGPADYDAGISYIKGTAKYEAIYGLNVKAAIQKKLSDINLPMHFRNDAEAAIVGEGVYGVGKGYSRIIGLTLGTGCGSAFLVDGVRQSSGAGVPENGWVYPILFDDEQADDVFSTRGLLKRLHDASINVETVAKAVKQAADNSKIRVIFHQFGHDLALFLQQFLVDFKPDAIILQGGIAQGFAYFKPAMTAVLPTPIFAGELGRDAALLGAANLFKST